MRNCEKQIRKITLLTFGAGKSFRICLAVEEIAGNIVEHGFTGKKENILLIFG